MGDDMTMDILADLTALVLCRDQFLCTPKDVQCDPEVADSQARLERILTCKPLEVPQEEARWYVDYVNVRWMYSGSHVWRYMLPALLRHWSNELVQNPFRRESLDTLVFPHVSSILADKTFSWRGSPRPYSRAIRSLQKRALAMATERIVHTACAHRCVMDGDTLQWIVSWHAKLAATCVYNARAAHTLCALMSQPSPAGLTMAVLLAVLLLKASPGGFPKHIEIEDMVDSTLYSGRLFGMERMGTPRRIPSRCVGVLCDTLNSANIRAWYNAVERDSRSVPVHWRTLHRTFVEWLTHDRRRWPKALSWYREVISAKL